MLITVFSKLSSDVFFESSVEYFVDARVRVSESEELYPVKSKTWEAPKERVVTVEDPSYKAVTPAPKEMVVFPLLGRVRVADEDALIPFSSLRSLSSYKELAVDEEDALIPFSPPTTLSSYRGLTVAETDTPILSLFSRLLIFIREFS